MLISLFLICTSNILDEGGNIFDAVIATMFCGGVATTQSMGLGGGFIMNIYKHDTKTSYILNSKEVAPLAATEDMFKTRDEYMRGVLAIGVPGEVSGLWELHKRFGSMPWKSLVEPTVKVCEDGIKLTKHMGDFIFPRLVDDVHLK